MLNLDGCSFTDLTLQATTVIYTFTFYLLLPYFLTVGLLSNCLLIASLARRTKSKSLYAYQLFLILGKTYENLTFGLFVAFCYWWAGLGGYTAPWFVSSYWLMYFTMRVLSPMAFVGFLLPPLLSVAMTCDRIFSLWRPIAYRKINSRKHRTAASTICLLLAIGLSFDKYWTYVIVEINTVQINGTKETSNLSMETKWAMEPNQWQPTYAFVANKDYNNATWGQVSASVRTYVRANLVVALIIANILMLILYRRRMNKLHAMTVSNQEKAQARKEANRDLLILSVCQSILTCFDQIPNAAGELLRQQSVYWNRCYLVIAPEYSAAIMLASSAEFWLLMAVDRKLRRNVPGYAMLRRVCPVGWFNQAEMSP